MVGSVRPDDFLSDGYKVTSTSIGVYIFLKAKLMSVTFKPESFIVEVKTNANPVESWLETQDELIDLLQSENEEMHLDRFHCLEIIRNMMPDVETAKKMLSAPIVSIK